MPSFTKGSHIVAALLLVASSVAFLTLGVQGSWSFALVLRSQKLVSLLLVATAIGVSTVLFATITNNRILTPALMGFDSLYMLIQTALTFLLGSGVASTLPQKWLYLGQVAAMVVVATYLFRRLFFGTSRSLHLVLLVGLVLGTLFRSLSTFLQRMLSPDDFVVLQDQLFASFNTVQRELLALSSLLTFVVLILIWRRRYVYDILALGRESAVNLGLEYRAEVTRLMVYIAVLVSVSTALVGPVTFFGLLVANLAYQTAASYRHAHVLPMAVMIGAVTLIAGQTVLERLLGFDTALSIVVEFLGGIVFIALLIRGSHR